MAKVLYESDRYLVQAGGEGSPIVSFQSYRPDQSIEAYRDKPWGANFLEVVGYSWVTVQPSFNDWYQSEEISKIAKIVRKHLRGEKPILYGSSMGGYAAYRFSGLFKAIGWLAIVPQHSPFNELVLETRWEKERSFLRDNGYTTGPLPNTTGVGVILYDDEQYQDHQHAEAIQAETGAKFHAISGSGHAVLEQLYVQGVLKDTILSQFSYIANEYYSLSKQKKGFLKRLFK